MALRDRQLGGIPLPKPQSIALALLMSACVPLLGYLVWYPLLHIPKELWPVLAVISTFVHIGMSSGIVPAGTERAQLWFGTYTNVSFPAGIYLVPKLPIPLLLLLVRFIFGHEIYSKILWSMEGDVSVQSITAPFAAKGMTKDGAHVLVKGRLVLEVESAAIYRSQTRNGDDKQTPVDVAIAEYVAAVKDSVIRKYTVAELRQGRHADGSSLLNKALTEAWNLIADFGISLSRSPLGEIEILSEQVEHALDRSQGKEIFTASAEALAEAFANYRQKNPGLSEEIAWASFASSQGLPPGVSINILKVK